MNFTFFIGFSTMLYEAFPAETRLTVYRGAPVLAKNPYAKLSTLLLELYENKT